MTSSQTASLDLPRVLLLTNEAPHSAGAGAIVLHRLFSGYPPDRLLVVTNRPPPDGAERLPSRYERLELAVDRINRTRFWLWRPALRALGASRLPAISRVDARLHGFRPQIVATLMQDSWYYELAARYARQRDLPLVVFVHDLPDGFEPVPSWLRARQQRRDATVYHQAVHRFCISAPMRDHFRHHFGIDGEVLLPPRSDTPVAQTPDRCTRLKTPGRVTLGYAGGLHYGYGEQLLRMLPALRATGTRLELYGPPPTGAVVALREATDVLHFNGYVSAPEEAWRRIMEDCDAVLQPYLDPPGEHTRQYRTHFPSKLGDALSLGLPLLISGPSDASGVAWCREHGDCALHVAYPTQPAAQAALLQLRDEPDLRLDLARRGQVAARQFAAPVLRQRLLEALTATVRT